MKFNCSNCSKVSDIKYESKSVDDFEIQYLECTICGKRYFSNITNEKIRKRLDRTDTIKPLRKQAYIETTRDMMKELESQQSELISEVIDEA